MLIVYVYINIYVTASMTRSEYLFIKLTATCDRRTFAFAPSQNNRTDTRVYFFFFSYRKELIINIIIIILPWGENVVRKVHFVLICLIRFLRVRCNVFFSSWHMLKLSSIFLLDNWFFFSLYEMLLGFKVKYWYWYYFNLGIFVYLSA